MVTVFIYKSERYKKFFCHDGVKEKSFGAKEELCAYLKKESSIRINLVPDEARTRVIRKEEDLNPLGEHLEYLLRTQRTKVSDNPDLVTSLAGLRRVNGYASPASYT